MSNIVVLPTYFDAMSPQLLFGEGEISASIWGPCLSSKLEKIMQCEFNDYKLMNDNLKYSEGVTVFLALTVCYLRAFFSLFHHSMLL